MRITNSMMRSNALWNINRNQILLNKYEMQLSGKKIQKPSDDPIIAVRALKFRSTLKEIEQYKTNSEDAISWIGVTEQAIKNTISLLKRARELANQGASGTYSVEDKEKMTAELEQIKIQLMNEGNVNYAGRYVFSGFKTDKPLVYVEDKPSTEYEITETFNSKSIETVQRVIDDPDPDKGINIYDISRIRLGYSDIDEATTPSTIAGLTVTTKNSTDADAYLPPEDTIYFLKDTGELIFNNNNLTDIPTSDFEFTYSKTGFKKGDMIPENYFKCKDITDPDPNNHIEYTKPADEMLYQISFNQELSVNTMGNQIFTSELARDFEEIMNSIKNIKFDDTIEDNLQKDLVGKSFGKMLGKLDKHLNTVIREEAVIGSKVNRLELTINRLADDKINFTELKSNNEDANVIEAAINLKSQETIYYASLRSSTLLMQQSLLDFMR